MIMGERVFGTGCFFRNWPLMSLVDQTELSMFGARP